MLEEQILPCAAAGNRLVLGIRIVLNPAGGETSASNSTTGSFNVGLPTIMSRHAS